MSIAYKALWIVESRLDAPPSLAEIARLCRVSPFHLARAFAAETGRPLIAYQRARRLTEAARALVDTETALIEIALDVGYGGHEAFTRAFRAEFGATPSAVRAAGELCALTLTNPFQLETPMIKTLAPPRIEDREAFAIAGLSDVFPVGDPSRVPVLWNRFAERYDAMEDRVGDATYGAARMRKDAETFEYLAGVEVSNSAKREGLSVWTIPAGRYAVFEHRDHISKIKSTFQAIFDYGLADADLAYAEGYEIERYDDRFDAATGEGVVEIRIPVS